MKEWADKYKGKFDDGWDKYRERVFQRAKAKGWIPAERAAHAAARRPWPSWDSIPEDEKPFQRRLMEVYAGFTEHVDHAGRPAGGRSRQARLRRQHADLLHLGRQRRLGRRPERHDQRVAGAERHSRPPSSSTSRRSTPWAGSRCSGRPRPTTCTTPAGPGPAAPRTRGPSSSPRTSAARATRWRSAGPRRSSPTRRRARSSTTSTNGPDHLRGRRHHPAAGGRTASRRTRSTASASPTRSTTRRPRGDKRTQYFEVMGSRAIYHDGWMASAFGPRTPWLPGLAARASGSGRQTRTSGSFTTSTRTGRRPTTWPTRCRRSWREMKELFLIEFTKNKGLPIGGGLWVPGLPP